MNEVSLVNTLKAIHGDCESWINSSQKDPLLQLARWHVSQLMALWCIDLLVAIIIYGGVSS